VGNVHRGADFADLTFSDFALSAVAIAPAMDAAPAVGIGRTVLSAIEATRSIIGTNSNLGMVLLIAPLAAVPRDQPLSPQAVRSQLQRMQADDAGRVYEAIRIAQPGGLGKVTTMDVADAPPSDLLAAMQAAADRDMVAREYVSDFRGVLFDVLPALVSARDLGWSLSDAIVHTHLQLIAKHGDSLIARKVGLETSQQAAILAGQALAAGAPGSPAYYDALADFDFWLRSDGNRRNPGATADLIAAAVFAGLRDGLLLPPFR
jgi:triphosphoribosyl-dephospho-CoA synthase